MSKVKKNELKREGKNEQNNQIIIYSTADGEMKLEVKLENETVWLSQKQMAELFDKDVRTINEHVSNVFFDGELDKISVIRNFRITAVDGKAYDTNLYNLDVIISVGYRVKSLRGTQFRIWATQKLKEYIIKGFVLDDERLSDGRVRKTYFQELEERIRNIRTSEANFYQKVRDIFATSVDYDPRTDYAKKFFAMVQNKFHYAITGLTASEIIHNRIDCNKENLGLTNWQGEIITREQAEIAKNYLEEIELRKLNLLVEQFLSYAERQVVKKRLMYMKNWVDELNEFMIFNKEKILDNAGSVSHQDMEEKVRLELAKYNQKRLGQHE
ncbi:MAG: RhuM family protein [Patescibacteria group bacterium]